MKIRFVEVVLLGCSLALAQDAASIALQQIASVDRFAFGGVGFAGATSKGEIGFKIIAKQSPEKALADFERLYSTGNPQAKAYALAGIRKLAPKRFSELRRSLSGTRIVVEIEQGCIISEQQLRGIADDLNAGKYDAVIRWRDL